MSKFIRVLAYIWFVGAGLIWTVGMLGVLIAKGLGEFLWTLSPFNIPNLIVTVLLFVPGFLLWKLADKLTKQG